VNNAEIVRIVSLTRQTSKSQMRRKRACKRSQQTLAADANERLQAANRPEATVVVAFRKALFTSGSVAAVKNSSARAIAVSVVAIRAGTSQQKQFELTIDGGMAKEIGERDGWAFLNGDTLSVSQSGHKPVTFPMK
jgi:hypothetical protein